MDKTQEQQQNEGEKVLPSFNFEQIQENVTINPSVVPYSSVPPKQPKSDSQGENKINKDKVKKNEAKKNQRGVQDNPEYYRVDFEICHKLYEIYRRLKLGTNQQSEGLSFDQRQQGSTTLNYHKILQMFKDINVRLEVSQKLSILRAIKKFSFNQNFIGEDQFSKIFKVIVHGVGIKQTQFKPLIREKYASVAQKQPTNMQRRAISIRLNKNFASKLKTEPAIDNLKVKKNLNDDLLSQSKTIHTIKPDVNTTYLKQRQTIDKDTHMEESKASGRRVESRKKMLTEASRYQTTTAPKGYLNRAMEKNKLHKVTWDSLFKMSTANMHPSISIPQIVSLDIKLDELYF